MASPTVESRVEPHKKAHFTLHISDRIANNDTSRGSYSSVKYNHKPAQTSDHRTTTLTSTSTNTYNLRLEDKTSSGDKDIFTFTGNRDATKKSYVLLFDPTSQRATLEPLSDSYVFNLSTRNNKNISSQHSKIYPKKGKEGQQEDLGEDDLFGEGGGDDEAGDPDPNNPYDFRHFLGKEKEKRGDESEYYAVSSPDSRAGTGSTQNTPQLNARKPAVVSATTAPKAKAKPAEPIPKKRRTAEADLFLKKKKPAKKAQAQAQAPPSIHLERRATERPAPEVAPKPKSKPTGPPASKIKSSELVHSSDESDMDGDDLVQPRSPPARQIHHSPSPRYHPTSDHEDEDAEGESDDDGDLEIEVPDARPSGLRTGGALKNVGFNQKLGVGNGAGFKSPSNGPISLASAASSVQGSPNPHNFTSRKGRTLQDDETIDFGDLGGVAEDAEGEDDDEDEEDNEDDGVLEIEDPDVDDIYIGPPARQSTSGHDRKASTAGAAPEEDEDDPLYDVFMAELASEGDDLPGDGAGDGSSEESEEE
ncbi:RNA polymerase II transcription elongation factor-domain-containing protein [Phaeosphaeriaceae sp. PMI808]|nr:RNA polymerase II transcription elongation factor-domain-containing protein [Phaeosphaeriaceae sp. PMI808]